MKHVTNRSMNRSPARWSVLALACLLVAACQDKRDPVRPSVGLAQSATQASSLIRTPA